MNKEKLALSGFKGKLGNSLGVNSGLILDIDAKGDSEQLHTHYNCTHQRKKIQSNGFHYCTDCGSKIYKNMPKKILDNCSASTTI